MSGTIHTPSDLMTNEIVVNGLGQITPARMCDVVESAAALVTSASSPQASTYTFTYPDRGCLVEYSGASLVNWTIPLNATVAYPLGAMLYACPTAASGQINIIGASTAPPNIVVNGTFATTANWFSDSGLSAALTGGTTPFFIGTGALQYNTLAAPSFPAAYGSMTTPFVGAHSYTFTYDLAGSSIPAFLVMANVGPGNSNIDLQSGGAGTGKSVTFTYGGSLQLNITSNGNGTFNMDNMSLIDNTAGGGSSVSVVGRSTTSAAQWSVIWARKRATDTWQLGGDLT